MNRRDTTRCHAIGFVFCMVAAAIPSLAITRLAGQEVPPAEHALQVEKPQHQERMVEIELTDKTNLKGRLCLPQAESDEPLATLVVFVQGTGPGTYLNRRKVGDTTFQYFDYFSNEFNDRNIAFFSYNKRGVTMGDDPPWFDNVDREAFRKVVPEVEARDIATIVDALKKHKRLVHARVVLLGWSEGTIIASMVAERFPEKVDMLLLAGYAHENLYDVIKWQFSGAGSMLVLNPVFDKDKDGKISPEEYNSDLESVARFRKGALGGASFALLDATKDGQLQAEDFGIRNKPMYSLLLHNTTVGNEDWIWNNYFRISIPWLQGHFSLEPNKSRLTRLELPIYVFHGTDDAHLDVQDVGDLQKRFTTLGKDNLQTFVFEEHDHDLNFMEWVLKGDMPIGLAKIFEVASGLGSSD